MTQGIDVKSMGRIFIGLIKCGAWGCFDEFNRLEEAVLSAVSMQIQVIQDAIKQRSPSVELLGRKVSSLLGGMCKNVVQQWLVLLPLLLLLMLAVMWQNCIKPLNQNRESLKQKASLTEEKSYDPDSTEICKQTHYSDPVTLWHLAEICNECVSEYYYYYLVFSIIRLHCSNV